MNMFRKLLSIALVLSMLAGFAVMGGLPVASAKEETKTVVTTTEEVKAEALEAEPTYTDLIYYVNGSSSWTAGDGKTAETALQGSTAAVFNKVKSDLGNLQSFPNGSRLVVRVIGGIANGGQSMGTNETLTCVDGTPVPIVFEGYGTGTNSIISTHKPANAGSCYWFTYNDVTFRNIRLKANAYKPSGSDTYSEFITCNFYANGHDVVFDNVTFASDANCTSTARQKWNVGADTAVGPNDVEAAFDGSITFLNGTYTGLGNVSAVLGNSWWRSDANGKTLYAHANATCTLTIGEGAVMGDVYGAYGNIQIKQATVNLAGGSVKNYRGTQNGSETTLRVYKTDLTTNMTGTVISENYYFGLGTYNDFTGNVVNNITGGFGAEKDFVGANTGTKVTGTMTNIVTGTAQVKSFKGFIGASVDGTLSNTLSGSASVSGYYGGTGVNGVVITGEINNTLSGNATIASNYYSADGNITVNGNMYNYMTGGTINAKRDVCFGGDATTKVTGEIVNTVSGGTIAIKADETNSSGVYFGGKSLTAANVTNNVTGGTITFADNRTDTSKSQKYVGVHFGPNNGTITGTLTNNVSGITIEGKLKATTGVYFGGQNLGWRVGKIVNTLGLQGVAGSGPVFNTNANVYLGGGWSLVGETTATSTQGLPETSVCTDDVVLSNTVYDITMNTSVCLYGGSSGNYYLNGSTVHNHYIKGSVETNIYGGTIGTLYGAGGNVPVYGHVTTNIYGGTFTTINGTSAAGDIYDGAELNIYKASKPEGAPVSVSMKPYQATANNGSKAVVSAATQGRAATALKIAAQTETDAVIYAVTVPATDASITIEKASFPKGLKVNDAAATADMLGDGCCTVNTDMEEISLANAAATPCYVTVLVLKEKVHCDCGARTKDSDPTDNCKGACDGTLRTWQPWTSANSLPKEATEAGFYYLTTNVTTTGQTSFKADATNQHTTFGIDLNGYNITHVVSAGTKDGVRALVAFGGYNADTSNAANTWKTDLIITDTAAVHGSVITDQSALSEANTSKGNVLWVRHGDVRVYNVTLNGADADTTDSGATVYIDSGRTLNMYNTTVIGGTTTSFGGAIGMGNNDTVILDSCTVSGGTAKNGGGIFAGGASTVTATATTVMNGTATVSGGNIYCNPGTTVNLTDCTVSGGSASASDGNCGGNIQVDGDVSGNVKRLATLNISGGTVDAAAKGHGIYVSQGNVTVSGAPQITDLYERTGALASYRYINVDLTGVTGGSVDAEIESVGYYGTVSQAAMAYLHTEKKNNSVFMYDGCLYIGSGNVASVIHEDNTTTAYPTFREAVANSTETDIVKQLSAFVDRLVVPQGQNLYFDVAGILARGTVTLSEGKMLYVLDSATDTYEDPDVEHHKYCTYEVYGGEIFTGAFRAPNAKRYYVANSGTNGSLSSFNAISANRFYIGITHMSFYAGTMSAGYRATVAGNPTVKSLLSDIDGTKKAFGVKFTANKKEIAFGADAADFLTGADHWSAAFQIKNILSMENTVAQNTTNANTPIVANVYIRLNGQVIESAEYSFTLKDMIQKADAGFGSLDATQKAVLMWMYKTWNSVVAPWDLTNIQAALGQ